LSSEGPQIEKLTRRLAEAPEDFLEEPVIGSKGVVRADAVVSDLLQDLGGPPLTDTEAAAFASSDPKKRNQVRLMLVAAWLLHDEWFTVAQKYAAPARAWLSGGLGALAGLVAADLFVSDPERREELARLCLSALGLRPQGEPEGQAQDRLNSLNSVEREKVIQATKGQLERARQIREAMRRRAAEEAAAKAVRE
jgi:hypothetical protein